MPIDPRDDTRVRVLKAIATKGGEFGPHYDQGVLSVIAQVESTGSFIPNRLGDMPLLIKGLLPLTETEKAEILEGVEALGMTIAEGVEYGRGINAAESHLRSYKQQ